MGAIAGVFHSATPKPVDPARVRRMIDVQAHRGPDGAGVWAAPGVGLGHRRLSAVDLAGSPQPVVNGALAITCDGAIYNSAALRDELRAKGAQPDGRGDAALLLHAWRTWGPAMLDRLHGAFALAIHDADAGTLFLARDRLGVKPLHYAELPDGALVFSSELKGVLAHPQLRRVPDLTAVEDYLALGYVPDDACLVAGVRKLAAGHYLLVQRGRPVPAPRPWWDVDFSTRACGSADALADELVQRMRDGVRSRMVADVPLGALLSGGIASAAVVALMAEASPRAVATCTMGSDDAGRDERARASAIAARFATDHRAFAVDGGDLSLIGALVRHGDEPFADASALAVLQCCTLARERMTVALTGDAADDPCGGYHRHRVQVAEERLRRLLPAPLRARVLRPLAAHWPAADWVPGTLRVRSTLEALGQSGAEAYARRVTVMTPARRQALFSDAARRALGGYRAEDRYIAAVAKAPARDALDAVQYADLKIRLPAGSLVLTDRTGMAVGLEMRQPLLDHRLVEFAATLPAPMRLRRGEGRWLMKRGLERYLPHDILYRPNGGAVTPVSAWFRGPLAGEAAALARSGTLAEAGWFDLPRLARLADDHRAGRAEHGRTLWQLLMLDKSVARLFS